MTGQPRTKPVDRTSAVVGAGMVTLLVLGVLTVFADTLTAALAPAPGASAENAPRASETPVPAIVPGSVAVDAAGGKS